MARSKVDPDRVVIGELTATPLYDRGEWEGKRYWRIRLRGGSRRTLWTDWATREGVEREMAEILRRGIPARPGPREDVRTVGDLLTRWTLHQEQRHKGGEIATRTLDNYRRAARYWRSGLDDLLASRLTRALVEDTLTKWLANGVAPRTCKLAAEVLTAAVAWGARRGHCPDVELARLSSVRIDDEEHVNSAYTPTRAELGRVFEALAYGRDRDVILLLALTGARIGEIAALHVRDYDREARTLLLRGRDEERDRRGKVKGRRWPVTGELLPLLERLAGDRASGERLVLELPQQPGGRVRHLLEEACAELGIERFTAHGLRRLVAMELLEVADPKRVSELTGHSVGTLLRYYVRPRAEDLRNLVARSGVASVEQRGKVRRLRAQIPGTVAEDDD